MDNRPTQTAQKQSAFNVFPNGESSDELINQRLNYFLEKNAETARMKAMYRSDQEKLEAEMMTNPLDFKKTYSYFGLLLGLFPPLTFFAKWFYESGAVNRDEGFIFILLLFVNLVTAVVGYFSGKFIGRTIQEAEKLSWTKMILVVPFIGLLWGIMSGGAGGVFIFVIGAFFGAFIGGIVGAAALPVFAVFHRLLKKGEMIEMKHFLPVAFGIVFTICSLILGL